jgi:hypothetical protein
MNGAGLRTTRKRRQDDLAETIMTLNKERTHE